MQNEKWFPIPIYPNYIISDLLRVKNIETGRIKSCYNDRGYLKLNVSHNGKASKPYLHRLVAMAFIPNPENKPEVHHIDEDTLNNHWTNLMWVTNKEHKEISKLNEQIAHKISRSDVVFIRDNYSEKIESELAIRFKVRKSTIYNIATHQARTDIKEGKINPLKGINKKVIDISTNEVFPSVEYLSKKTGIKLRTLRRMVSGERYNYTNYRYLGNENVVKIKPIVEKTPTPIWVFSNDWKEVDFFKYISDAALFVGTYTKNIYAFLKGKSSHVKGYKFKRLDENGNYIEPIPFVSKKPPLKPKKIKQPVTPSKTVIQYDLKGNELNRFNSIFQTAKYLKVDRKNFSKMVRKSPRNFYKGHIYKFTS